MKDNELQSRLIFLDTNTYFSKNFQFESYDLAKLKKYIDSENMHLLITDVNVREIKKHLLIKSKEAVAVIKSAQKDAMILRNTKNLSWAGIFDHIDATIIYDNLNKQFEDYLKGPNVEIISVSIANISAVFDAYFDETPPFDAAGKKAEFPDAFVLSAIHKICSDRGHKLYVVSNDGDFKRYCAKHDNLISINKVEELIDLIVRNSAQLSEPANFADEIYLALEDQIKTSLSDKLESAEFDIEEDWENEVEIDEIEIESFEIISKNIIDVTKESAVYEINLKLTSIVSILITDYDRSPWDSEDKAYVFLLSNNIVKRYTSYPTVILNLTYDDGIKANAEIESLDISDALDLADAKFEVISYKEMDVNDYQEDEPDEPDYPDEPDEPDEPDYPDEPDEPDYQGELGEPDEPDEPNEPDYLDEQDGLDYRDDPDFPVQPDESDEPDYSDEPDEPDYSDEPDEPDYPDEPDEPDEPDYPDQPR